jgi:hypothetical protein
VRKTKKKLANDHPNHFIGCSHWSNSGQKHMFRQIPFGVDLEELEHMLEFDGATCTPKAPVLPQCTLVLQFASKMENCRKCFH